VVVHQHTRIIYRGVPLRLIYFVENKQLLTVLAKQEPTDRKSSHSMLSPSHVGLQHIDIQINEEAKLLTDFKSMIGDKNEPFSIRTLKKVGSLSFLLMIGMAIAGLVLFDQRKQQIE